MEGCSPPSSIKFTTIYHLYFIIPPFSYYQALFSPPDRRM